MSLLFGEEVGVADGPEVEEREVTCTNKVSIVFPSSFGPGVPNHRHCIKTIYRVFWKNKNARHRRKYNHLAARREPVTEFGDIYFQLFFHVNMYQCIIWVSYKSGITLYILFHNVFIMRTFHM